MERTARGILTEIASDPWMMEVLESVRRLCLPDAWVSGGFVRSKVWDVLHGHTGRTPLDDIDVVYFDPTDRSIAKEKEYEQQLAAFMPGINWSVKNQARMHLRSGDSPYRSVSDAMSKWPETATAVAVALTPSGKLRLLAPHGIRDLLELRVRPTPHFMRYLDRYEKRLADKDWLRRWPKLMIEHPSPEADRTGLRQSLGRTA